MFGKLNAGAGIGRRPLSRAAVAIPILSVMILMGGCELLGTISNHDSDLVVNQRVWNEHNTGFYFFTLVRGCFCAYAGEYQVVVADNEVVDVIPAWDDQVGVPREDYDIFQTVDDLFEVIRNAYRNGADEIDVEYSDVGYPSLVSIDYMKNAVDDEVSYAVSDVRFTSFER
jgi:hypothetical protein